MATTGGADGAARDPLESTRAIAGEIARDAGRLLMEGLGTRPALGFKSEDINLVTEYDKRSEALIVERLARAFPSDRIVAEEGTIVGNDRSALRVWSVDPLDGTTNFAHGLPIFSVSLGLCEGTRPVLGVVEAPALGWTFAGTTT
ncbi:MAG TPA: inositol monophosphatase family protein, partial [Polyangia bacterium]|nr:inositol monophosphatase family protein [Polyangia bacterium]